jgi:hypothetical protein
VDSRPALALVATSLVLLACSAAPRFPLRAPLWHDPDDKPFAPPPREYVSPFAWDGADQTVFRPISRFLAVDPADRAVNVNALDEVPDSSWFTNRIGRAPMTAEQVARGSCGARDIDPSGPDGSWIIDRGKPDGANPGFRVKIPGLGKFMLKSDDRNEPDRATGATAIATRLYHAAGYFAPCDSVVYFRPSLLHLTPGLVATDNWGTTRTFDQAALDRVLAQASYRGGLVRMVASQWLPGKSLGPFRYSGTRADDPNDVVPHEDRRELRGARLIAAWLNHFDSREQNTMDVFLSPKPKNARVPGVVRHYILDLGDCFGSRWAWDAVSRRLGFTYFLDIPYLTEDFVTLGTIERPWERARRDGGIFGYFSARDFDPDLWRGEYPNPAFARMTEEDGAWMARILARFTDSLVAAAVRVGQYDADSTAYLTRTLIARRDVILRRYLGRLSPLADVTVEGDQLHAVDLAARARVAGEVSRSYDARLTAAGTTRTLRVTTGPGGEVTLHLVHSSAAAGASDDPSRYVVVDVAGSTASGPLRVNLYDLGLRGGFRLAGLERPDD